MLERGTIDPSGLRSHQAVSAEILRQALLKHGVAADGSDTGCLAGGTPVLMFDGRVLPVELIQHGDLLMGPDSLPRQVYRLYRGSESMVRIVPIKGDSFVVNRSHILTLQRTNLSAARSDARRNGEVIDVSVAEYLTWSKTRKRQFKLFRVAVAWPPRDQCLRPYHLGVLLGDGNLKTKNDLSLSKPGEVMHLAAVEIAAQFEARLTTSFRGPGNPSHHFRRGDSLWNELQKLNLAGTDSGNKFIPASYKVATWEQRRQLLAGLLDTDGSACFGGYDYISKSETLARDIAFVARSIGLAAYVTPCEKYCQTGGGGTYFRVSISGDCSIIPCNIKPAPARRQKKSVLRTGFTCEELPPDKFFGFSLDGDGRFLLGDFTVTHNTGKTHKACALVRHFNLPTLVVCPKVIKTKWVQTARSMGTDLDAINYEMVRTGRTPYGKWNDRGEFVWHPGIKFLIFDEAHRTKGQRTQNSQLPIAARRQNICTLLCSATLAESPLDMKAIGYALGLFRLQDYWRWCRNYGCVPGYFGGFKFIGWKKPDAPPQKGLYGEDVFPETIYDKQAPMLSLHKQIFESRGHRTRIADIPDFPTTQITAELVDLDCAKKIDVFYQEMDDAMRELNAKRLEDLQRAEEKARRRRERLGEEHEDDEKDAEDEAEVSHLTKLLRINQEIELLKVPGFAELAQNGLAAGNRVCIFVQFSTTLDELSVRLNTDCIFDGRLPDKVRKENHRRFQADESPVILLQEQAGGEAIDLQGRNRLSLISPGQSARRLRQIFGRVNRDGGEHSIQQVILAAGTAEERNLESLRSKLDCLDAINDADLNPCNLKT